MLKKKIWPNFQRIIELFTQKIVTNSQIWVWGDPGSEILEPGSGKKTYSGSRILGPGSKRHQNPDPNPQHCQKTRRKSALGLSA